LTHRLIISKISSRIFAGFLSGKNTLTKLGRVCKLARIIFIRFGRAGPEFLHGYKNKHQSEQLMNPLDVMVIVILGFCLVRGIFRGLIKEVSSIVGVLAGFYAAYAYYPWPGKLLSRWIVNPGYRNIVGFLIIFLMVLFIVGVLGILIKYVLKIASLGWLDRICGAGFATVKGILIVAVVILMLTTFLPKGAPIIAGSLLSPYVMRVSGMMIKIVPDEMKTEFLAKFKEINKVWKLP
jgi:membrane protein required for colicin V production